jgi:hypothetical protein
MATTSKYRDIDATFEKKGHITVELIVSEHPDTVPDHRGRVAHNRVSNAHPQPLALVSHFFLKSLRSDLGEKHP